MPLLEMENPLARRESDCASSSWCLKTGGARFSSAVFEPEYPANCKSSILYHLGLSISQCSFPM